MSEAEAFDALVSELYPVWFRFHPDVALEQGLTDLGDHLPAAEDDELGALEGGLEGLMLALGELDGVCLDAERRLDLRLLQAALRAEYRELLVRDWRHLDPTRFLPVQEIFQLTLHPPKDLDPVCCTCSSRCPAICARPAGSLPSVQIWSRPTW
jgi:hypothetical protein